MTEADAIRINSMVRKGFYQVDKAIMANENIGEQIMKINPRSLQEARDYECTTLASMRAYKGENAVIVMLISWLEAIRAFFNVAYGMESAQVRMLAYKILQNHYLLKVSELKWVFNTLESMDIKHRLDGNVILAAFRKYREDRETGEDSYNNHLSTKFTGARERQMDSPSNYVGNVKEEAERIKQEYARANSNQGECTEQE